VRVCMDVGKKVCVLCICGDHLYTPLRG